MTQAKSSPGISSVATDIIEDRLTRGTRVRPAYANICTSARGASRSHSLATNGRRRHGPGGRSTSSAHTHDALAMTLCTLSVSLDAHLGGGCRCNTPQHTPKRNQAQPAETRECSPAAFVGALQGHSNRHSSQRQQDQGNLRICSEHGRG